MTSGNAKLIPGGDPVSVTIPPEVMEAAGLGRDEPVTVTARADGEVAVRRAGDAALDAAFGWSFDRYEKTYADLAK